MCLKVLRFPIKTLDGSYTVQEKPLGAEGTQSLLRQPSLITALFVAENLNGVVRGGAAGGNVAGVTAVEGALFEELNHPLRIWMGNSRRISSSTSVKMAVLAPMPSASVRTAETVNTGDLRNWRTI